MERKKGEKDQMFILRFAVVVVFHTLFVLLIINIIIIIIIIILTFNMIDAIITPRLGL